MAVGQLIALALPAGCAVAYAICFARSVASSVPPVRLKAVTTALLLTFFVPPVGAV